MAGWREVRGEREGEEGGGERGGGSGGRGGALIPAFGPSTSLRVEHRRPQALTVPPFSLLYNFLIWEGLASAQAWACAGRAQVGKKRAQVGLCVSRSLPGCDGGVRVQLGEALKSVSIWLRQMLCCPHTTSKLETQARQTLSEDPDTTFVNLVRLNNVHGTECW